MPTSEGTEHVNGDFRQPDHDRPSPSEGVLPGARLDHQPHFTDENAACVVIDEHIYLMVLTREFFSTFTSKPIPDPRAYCHTQTSLSAESRDAVDAFLEKVLAAGGTEPREAQDYGFMYSRDFEDPDGNEFGILWMDPKASELGPEEFMANQEQGSAD